jgi:hypothetical protein
MLAGLGAAKCCWGFLLLILAVMGLLQVLWPAPGFMLCLQEL